MVKYAFYKYGFLLCVFAIFASSKIAFSQVLTGDATGQSTLLFQGGNIGFNLQEQAFDFSYNAFKDYRLGTWLKPHRYDEMKLQQSISQLQDSITIGTISFNKKDSTSHAFQFGRIVWGINAHAKAATGLGAIFSGGNVVPDARLGGYLGWSRLTGLEDSAKIKIEAYKLLVEHARILTTNYSSAYLIAVRKKSKEIVLQDSVLKIHTDSLLSEVEKILQKTDNVVVDHWAIGFFEAASQPSTWANTFALDSARKVYYKQLSFEVEKLYKSDYVGNIQPSIKALNDALDALIKYRKYWKIRQTYYLNFGLTGVSFTQLIIPLDRSDLNNSLVDKTFTGSFINLGYNLHLGGKGILGITAGWERKSSFNALSSVNYSLADASTTDSLKHTLSTRKDITVYSGTFERYSQWNINIDYARFLKIDEVYNIVPSFYLRHRIPIKASTAVTATDVGISSYFFKDGGSFAGGLYAQITDIGDNGRTLRPTQNRLSLGERWNFGVVSKINISTLLGY